jgi:hypothetical protein
LNKLKTTFIVHRDVSTQKADGYILIDDGVSANTWETVNYKQIGLIYNDKVFSFGCMYGDCGYSAPAGSTFDHLEEVVVVDAEDLADTDSACFKSSTLGILELSAEYNPYTNTLFIRPTSDQ